MGVGACESNELSEVDSEHPELIKASGRTRKYKIEVRAFGNLRGMLTYR